MRPHFVLLAPLLALAPGVPASSQSLEEHPRVREALGVLEAWVSAKRDFDRLPGVSMAVVHDQDILWSDGFGYAHMETEAPAAPGTMYSICSISKLFTSIGVMQLRDAGKIDLDDPVERHLEWFRIDDPHERGGPVTVRGLLTHSSGLPRESDHPYWTGPEYPFPPREAVVERLSAQEMLYAADTYYQYSNLGLTLAGEIVAAVGGVSFDEYVRSHILEPLGLKDTYADHPEQHRGGRFATGYSAIRRDGSREVVPPYSVRGIAPAAGFVSTVEDLARFASWQFRALEGEDEGVLSRNTLREMHRVHWVDPDWETTRGLGFSVWQDKDEEETFVGHGGYCPGYQSHLLLSPGDRVATVFMTNTNGLSSRSFTQTAYEIVAPAVAEALDAESETKWADPELERFTGRYTNWLAGEAIVLPWKGSLAVLTVPTDDPMESLTELKHLDGGVFQRIRDDGTPGEKIVFESDQAGQVTRMWRHSNPMTRAPLP
jgi:CubicO group peptidase (beta-lactamase class C family)